MKKLGCTISLALLCCTFSFGQARLEKVKSKQFKTTEDFKISGDVGYLVVPENRRKSASREIKLKFVHLKSLAENPLEPVIFLEGGGGTSTWQADSPSDLTDWVEILKVSDLIFLDRRGSGDQSLYYIWIDEFPENFFVSEEEASLHYHKMYERAVPYYEEKNIDITGYDIEQQATDVNELMTLLGEDRYNIFGFSFGSHIGMATMALYPDRINKAILAGADAPNQSFNFPKYLDDHVAKINAMIQKDSAVNKAVPDLGVLIGRVMDQLKETPARIKVTNPVTKKEMDLQVGPFGLALVLRLEMDDANDIPVIPRLLYAIEKGDYEMLTWFIQKRLVFSLAFPGADIHQQLASGATDERWSQILREAKASPFGNTMNFPFYTVKDQMKTSEFAFDPSIPMNSDIPTLFISGTLDARTPLAQVEETMKGFTNAVHVRVGNAGHEQAMWEVSTFDEKIPAFLKGEEVMELEPARRPIKFLPVEGPASGHPSLKEE